MSYISHAVLTFILLQFNFAATDGAWKKFTAVPTKYDCAVHNTALVQRFNCSLDNSSSSNPLLNTNLVVNRKVVRVDATVKFFYERGARMMQLFATEIDYCAALSKSNPNYIIGFILREHIRKGNQTPRCPLKKNFEYYIHNFSISRFDIPNTGIETSWLAIMEFKGEGKKALSFRVYGKQIEM